MKEKLKKALRDAGLNEGLADVLNINSEDQIATVVAQLKGGDSGSTMTAEEMLASESVTNYLKEKGFDAVLKLNKTLQSEHDKKVHQGVQTFKKKVLGDPDPDPNPNPNPNPNPAPTDGVPDWFKPFAGALNELVKGKVVESKLDLAKKAMASSSLPENLKTSWLSRINLESETSFEEQVKALTEEYKSIHVGIVGKEAYEFQEQHERKPQNGKLSESELKELQAVAKDL